MRLPLPLVSAAICAALAGPSVAQAVSKQFRTPTGKILCLYSTFEGRSQIRCDLLFLNDRAAVVGASGRGRIIKVTDAAGNPRSKVLAYGTSTSFGAYSCTLRRTGLTCRNRRSGHGFTVSTQSRKVF